MSYQNRKAVARSFLILMLLAILSLTIIIYAMNQFFTRADQAVDEQACRASILTRVKSTLKVGGVLELNPFPIVCKTQHKVLEGNEEQVKIQISDLSARCWYMFLNGEYGNIFNKKSLFSDNMCFICYTFNIKDDIKPITGEKLFEYMDEHYYITKAGEKGEEEGVVTYLDYIQRWKGEGLILLGEDVKEGEDIKFVGNEKDVYTISLISPDISFVGGWTDDIFTFVNIFKSSEQKEQESKLKNINKIYIANMKVDDKNQCVNLKSI